MSRPVVPLVLWLTPAIAAAQVPLETYEGGQVDAALGAELLVAGDLDGDGRADLAVGVPGKESASTATLGSVRLHSGADGALLGEATGALGGTQFGAALAAAPDLDGDGTPDLLVGAPADGGRVVALDGAALADGRQVELWSRDGAGLGGLGRGLAALGDLDGDGVADVAAGEPFHDVQAPGSNDGRVMLLSGADGAELRTIDGPADQLATFGWSLIGVGDLDADGLDDLAVGAPGAQGTAGAGSFAGAVHLVSSAGALLAEVPGDVAGGQLGLALAAGPDLDGDGVATVVAGAPAQGLGATGVGQVLWIEPLDPMGPAVRSTVAGATVDGGFGAALELAPPGIAGFDDDVVAVGAPTASLAGRREGVVSFVDLGDGAVIARWNGPEAGCDYGAALAWSAPDGAAALGTFAIGAPNFDAEGEIDGGRVEVYDAAELAADGGPRFWASARVAAAGQPLQWSARLDRSLAGLPVVLLGSASGPGRSAALAGVELPLAPDGYLGRLAHSAASSGSDLAFTGLLDRDAAIDFTWTPPVGAGDRLLHALIVLDAPRGRPVSATDAIPLELE